MALGGGGSPQVPSPPDITIVDKHKASMITSECRYCTLSVLFLFFSCFTAEHQMQRMASYIPVPPRHEPPGGYRALAVEFPTKC